MLLELPDAFRLLRLQLLVLGSHAPSPCMTMIIFQFVAFFLEVHPVELHTALKGMGRSNSDLVFVVAVIMMQPEVQLHCGLPSSQ